jgi:hypothetical protein
LVDTGGRDAQRVEATVSWLLRERVSVQEWRFQDSDLVWEAGDFDTSRFEVHVLDERVVAISGWLSCAVARCGLMFGLTAGIGRAVTWPSLPPYRPLGHE